MSPEESNQRLSASFLGSHDGRTFTSKTTEKSLLIKEIEVPEDLTILENLFHFGEIWRDLGGSKIRHVLEMDLPYP